MAELNLAKFGKIETLIWLFQKSWPGNTVTPLMYGSNWVPWHEQVCSLSHSIVPLGTEPEPVARKSVVVGWAWEADVTGETIEGWCVMAPWSARHYKMADNGERDRGGRSMSGGAWKHGGFVYTLVYSVSRKKMVQNSPKTRTNSPLNTTLK